MKQIFKNLDEAINTIADASQKHAQATETGDYKTVIKITILQGKLLIT